MEDFESLLEQNPAKSGQLRMLHFACASRARKRTVTLTRPSRDEPLQFELMGGSERGFGIFLEKVVRGSKASEIGLKRGDQILEVNRRSFEQNMTLEKAKLILKENTHLEMNVKSNLLGNFEFFTFFKRIQKVSFFLQIQNSHHKFKKIHIFKKLQKINDIFKEKINFFLLNYFLLFIDHSVELRMKNFRENKKKIFTKRQSVIIHNLGTKA